MRLYELENPSRFKYWTEEETEPDEVRKLWHYIKDSNTGQVYNPDWDPYDTMTPDDVNLYMRLTLAGREPNRRAINSIGPLDHEKLQMFAKYHSR